MSGAASTSEGRAEDAEVDLVALLGALVNERDEDDAVDVEGAGS